MHVTLIYPYARISILWPLPAATIEMVTVPYCDIDSSHSTQWLPIDCHLVDVDCLELADRPTNRQTDRQAPSLGVGALLRWDTQEIVRHGGVSLENTEAR